MDSISILTILQFVGGVIGLVLGAQLLVQGAAKLAVTIGVPSLVIGLTVVAFGTGSPELAVTVRSALTDQADIGVGNVVGSNIANILLVLGCSAVVTPLAVRVRVVRWDVPVMIGASFLLFGLSWGGMLSRVDGAILFGCVVLYIIIALISGRWTTAKEKAMATELQEDVPEAPAQTPLQFVIQLVLIAVGLVLLVIGSDQLVISAVKMAEAFGVDQLVIGLTVVAIGTSLPEAATSVVAGLRGERDIALGNVVGSNIFNILAVLGLASLVAPTGILVNKDAIGFDIPVMIAAALACLPIVFTGARIERWEGLLFLGYYIAYMAYLFVWHEQHHLTDEFNLVMLAFVIPLTILGLGLTVVRAIKSGQTPQTIHSQQTDEATAPPTSSQPSATDD